MMIHMNFRYQPWALVVSAGLAMLLSLTTLDAAPAAGPHSLALGGRYHAEHSLFTDLPYGDGDISYALAYQYIQGFATWQLACDLGPDISGYNELYACGTTNLVGIDYIITPQFHIIIRDLFFRGGGGIRTSYIRDVDGEGEWLDPYWQLQLGLAFPLGQRLSLDLSAYYGYEHWGKPLDFKFSDLEYGAWLNVAF